MCVRVDCVLVTPIIISCEVDPEGLMNVYDVVEHHKLGIVLWLDGETIKEKRADEMARKLR
jgi:hypothetical protein